MCRGDERYQSEAWHHASLRDNVAVTTDVRFNQFLRIETRYDSLPLMCGALTRTQCVLPVPRLSYRSCSRYRDVSDTVWSVRRETLSEMAVCTDVAGLSAPKKRCIRLTSDVGSQTFKVGKTDTDTPCSLFVSKKLDSQSVQGNSRLEVLNYNLYSNSLVFFFCFFFVVPFILLPKTMTINS